MKKCLFLASALLFAATACQPKVRHEKSKAVEEQCEEEEEASRAVSDEFSIEEEQFQAIIESTPQQNVVEELVQEGTLDQDQPVAETVVEEQKPVAEAVVEEQKPVVEAVVEEQKPVAEAAVEEVKPVADAVEQNQPVVEKSEKATTENEPAVIREPVKAKKESGSM